MLEGGGVGVENVPLAYCRHQGFFTLRTDARDRFGTPLERRFARAEEVSMTEGAGLEGVRGWDWAPFWFAVGFRRRG